jgi:hypothetical protein
MKNPTTKALPQNIIERMRTEDRKSLGVHTRVELEEAYVVSCERDMQRTVEAWLCQHGYWPRTQERLSGGVPGRGWYIHLNETRRNPYLLDLLVLGLDGRHIEIELKIITGKMRPEQVAIIAAGGSVTVCYSAQDAIDAVLEWEAQ